MRIRAIAKEKIGQPVSSILGAKREFPCLRRKKTTGEVKPFQNVGESILIPVINASANHSINQVLLIIRLPRLIADSRKRLSNITLQKNRSNKALMKNIRLAHKQGQKTILDKWSSLPRESSKIAVAKPNPVDLRDPTQQ